jgi:polynucleotide 5'-kinase involved in rRNA processing
MVSDDKAKETLLETYKNENITVLENVNEDSSIVKERIANTIKTLKEMKFKSESVDDDIIRLHELKKDLL